MGQVTSTALTEFVNCTSPLSTCEVLDPILSGTKGSCDVPTGVCVCPIGYDGDDLWAKWNDCHVNAETRTIVQYIATALLGLCFLFSAFGLVRLLILWGILYWGDSSDYATSKASQQENVVDSSPKGVGIIVSNETVPLAVDGVRERSISQQQQPQAPARRKSALQVLVPNIDLSEIQAPRPNARTNMFQQMLAERKRRRNTLVLLVVWMYFSAAAIAFQIYRHLGYRFEQRIPFMLLCLPGAMTGALMGLWSLTYTWFSNLPSLRAFASMFPSIRGNLLIKYPKFIRNFTILNVVGVSITSWTLFFLLPMIDARYINAFLIELTLAIFALQIAVFTCTHSMVCLVLLKLFRTFDKSTAGAASPKSAETTRNVAKFSDGKLTVNVMLWLSLTAGPFFTAYTLSLAFSPVARRHFYFFFSFIFGGGALCGLIITYIFVFRMGANTRTRKGSTSSSPNIGTRKSFNKKVSIGEGQLSPISEA